MLDNKYCKNDTMKLIGQSKYWQYCSFPDGIYSKGFREIIEGNMYSNKKEMALDMFSYGVICGIHEAQKNQK